MDSNFNLKYWPIVYFKSTGKNVDEYSFENYQKHYLNLLLKCKNNNEKMILICDLNNLNSYPMNLILKQVEFSKKIYKHNKEYVRNVYIYCKNKNFKNILNLFFTLIKPACPYKLCRSPDKIYKDLNDKFDIKLVDNIFNSIDVDNSVDDFVDNIYETNNLDDVSENLDNSDNSENSDYLDNQDSLENNEENIDLDKIERIKFN